jgi:protein-S-isoprenylcysteine O-methyltransferase Ste14
MLLRERFASDGEWLFRRRGWLPALLVPALIGAMWQFVYPAGSEWLDDLWELSCFGVSCIGLAIRAYAIGHAAPGTSGGNTKIQKAAALNTDGAYSVVRHPLYLGNFFMSLGVILLARSLPLVAIYALAFALYYERIAAAEERFLDGEMGEKFRSWAAKTPAFLPNFRLWRPPSQPFSLKRVLRREYTGVYLLILLFVGLEVWGDFWVEGHWELEPAWAATLAGSTVCYLGILAAKRWTRWLVLDRQPDRA